MVRGAEVLHLLFTCPPTIAISQIMWHLTELFEHTYHTLIALLQSDGAITFFFWRTVAVVPMQNYYKHARVSKLFNFTVNCI
jgi:hypothetical protein